MSEYSLMDWTGGETMTSSGDQGRSLDSGEGRQRQTSIRPKPEWQTNETKGMSHKPAIMLEGVSRQFGKQEVLHDINLKVHSTEIFGLLGPSGAGKTTLVKMVAGLDEPTRGKVYVSGVRMPALRMLGEIGYMAQLDALYLELTAQENLDFFASVFGLRGHQKSRRIHQVMELVGLTVDRGKLVSAYSGGMKRRLSLAIALLHEPGILILDEPTVGIDPLLRKSIWEELQALSRQGTTLLMTTHVMDEAAKCHRLGMIRGGELIATGTPMELISAAGVSTLDEAFLHYGEVKKGPIQGGRGSNPGTQDERMRHSHVHRRHPRKGRSIDSEVPVQDPTKGGNGE